MSQCIIRPIRAYPVRLLSGRAAGPSVLRHHRFSSDFSHLNEELTARRLPLVYDHISPTHSHLLNVSLADHLPGIANAPSKSTTAELAEPRMIPSSSPSPPLLSPAQHICYFPPAIPGSLLLPDGTDPLQSPGEPFTRRMWAGGRLRFENSSEGQLALALDGQRMVCVEGIRDVAVKGKPGEEKVFVGVERRIGRLHEDNETEDSIRARLWTAEEEDMGDAAVVERRNIVFLRERNDKGSSTLQKKQEQPKQSSEKKKGPAHAPQHEPDYAHTLYPDARLLFRYSALTFNAHAIHLDPSYCRDVEGHRGLLVHGPMSITLLVTLLRFWLFQKECKALASAKTDSATFEAIRDVEYRNLAPVYSPEPLRLCGRRMESGKYEIWAETPSGDLAVRGIARTEEVAGLDGRGPAELYEDLAMAVNRGGSGVGIAAS